MNKTEQLIAACELAKRALAHEPPVGCLADLQTSSEVNRGCPGCAAIVAIDEALQAPDTMREACYSAFAHFKVQHALGVNGGDTTHLEKLAHALGLTV